MIHSYWNSLISYYFNEIDFVLEKENRSFSSYITLMHLNINFSCLFLINQFFLMISICWNLYWNPLLKEYGILRVMYPGFFLVLYKTNCSANGF